MVQQTAAAAKTAAETPIRERLLDSAEACVERFGPSKTSMEDVARAAGVSRATVYRYFDNRDDVLGAVASRQAAEVAAEALGYLAERYDNMSDWIVEGLLFSLREIPKRPAFAALTGTLDTRSSSRLLLGSAGLIQIGVSACICLVVQPDASGADCS